MASNTHIDKGLQREQGITYPMYKRLFTLKEAGLYLGRSEYSIRTLVWGGILPIVKHGKKQWIDLEDMNSFIERNKEVLI